MHLIGLSVQAEEFPVKCEALWCLAEEKRLDLPAVKIDTHAIGAVIYFDSLERGCFHIVPALRAFHPVSGPKLIQCLVFLPRSGLRHAFFTPLCHLLKHLFLTLFEPIAFLIMYVHILVSYAAALGARLDERSSSRHDRVGNGV